MVNLTVDEDFTVEQLSHLIMASDGFGIIRWQGSRVHDIMVFDGNRIRVKPSWNKKPILEYDEESHCSVMAVERLKRTLLRLKGTRLLPTVRGEGIEQNGSAFVGLA